MSSPLLPGSEALEAAGEAVRAAEGVRAGAGWRGVRAAAGTDEAKACQSAVAVGHTPPSERYLNLLIGGMEHFKCEPAAVAEMRRTPHQGPGTT